MGMLPVVGFLSLLLQGAPGGAGPDPALRTTYRCGGDLVVPVWASGAGLDLFLDGRLERLVAPRPSQPRYVNERREWRVTRDGARLSIPGQSDTLRQDCVPDGHQSFVPSIGPQVVTCDDARSVVLRPRLEGLRIDFQGESLDLREVPQPGGILYLGAQRQWRGKPGAFVLSDAGGSRVQARNCRWVGAPETARLEGTVSVNGGRSLPPGAIVEVRLVEASRADAPATSLARQVLVVPTGSAPLPFAVTYARAVAPMGGHYLLQATASVQGRVRWRTSTAVVVLAGEDPGGPVTLVLEPMR